MEWPQDPASTVRCCFCVALAASLAWYSGDRVAFFELRTRYIEGLGRAPDKVGASGFYTNTFAELATPAWPVSLLPGVGGWPKLTCRQYTVLVRTHVLELFLLGSAVAPAGGQAAALLGAALCSYLLLFGQ